MSNEENKDKLIESVFDGYVDGIKPPPELLQPAVMLLRAQNIEKNRRNVAAKKPLKKKLFAFAALGVAVIMLLSYIMYSFMGLINNRTKYYSRQELSSVVVSQVEVDVIKNSMVITVDLFPKFEYETKYTLFYFTGTYTTAYIVCKSRYVSDGGGVDVKITAELTKDILDDFKGYYNLSESIIEGTTVNHKETYEDGEYVVNALLIHNGIKYYLEFMCPFSISIEAYAELILSL